MILKWNDNTCRDLIMKMAKELDYSEHVEQIRWLTCVAYSDDNDTELRLVAKLCSAKKNVVMRVYSHGQSAVKEKILFQKILLNSGVCVPKILKVINVELTEQLSVTAYLEEWIDGLKPVDADYFKYTSLLGRYHAVIKNVKSPFSSKRDHILYDIDRIANEMRNKLCCNTTDIEALIVEIAALMNETQKLMLHLKRYPVHGDYSTDNIIRCGNSLFMIDFERSANGYLPEEAGEAFAEIMCSCFGFEGWKEQLKKFFDVYSDYAELSELERYLTESVARIALLIRVLQKESDVELRLMLCKSILNKEGRLYSHV